MGGLSRIAGYCRTMKAENPATVAVSTGDLLFPDTPLKPYEEPQAQAIAHWLLTYFPGNLLHLSRRDRALLKTMDTIPGTYVLMDAAGEGPPAAAMLTVSGLKLGFIALDPPSEPEADTAQWIEAVNTAANTMRRREDPWAIIAVSTLGLGEDRRVAPRLEHIDIILGVHHEKFLETAGIDDGILSAHIAGNAKYLGCLELRFDDGFPGHLDVSRLAPGIRVFHLQEKIRDLNTKIARQKEIGTPASRNVIKLLEKRRERYAHDLQEKRKALHGRSFLHRGLPLDSRAPEDATLAALMKNLRPALKRVNMKAPDTTAADLRYAGRDVCAECHSRQADFVRRQKHSRAWASLVKDGADGDVSCIPCHSAGFGQTGGVKHISRIAPYRDVQCESCHGPGRSHAENPETRSFPPVTRETCRRCHTLEHSDETIDTDMMRRFHCPPRK